MSGPDAATEARSVENAGTDSLEIAERLRSHNVFTASVRIMKLLPSQTDEKSLLGFGREAVSLLENRDFHSLADRFGYIFAQGRSPAAAVEQELGSCITEYRASLKGQSPVRPSTTVKYFKRPNDSGLFALVECVFTTSEGCPILAELIVTSSEEDHYVFLEEVSLIRS